MDLVSILKNRLANTDGCFDAEAVDVISRIAVMQALMHKSKQMKLVLVPKPGCEKQKIKAIKGIRQVCSLYKLSNFVGGLSLKEAKEIVDLVDTQSTSIVAINLTEIQATNMAKHFNDEYGQTGYQALVHN